MEFHNPIAPFRQRRRRVTCRPSKLMVRTTYISGTRRREKSSSARSEAGQHDKKLHRYHAHNGTTTMRRVLRDPFVT